jgi:hypothetical protein
MIPRTLLGKTNIMPWLLFITEMLMVNITILTYFKGAIIVYNTADRITFKKVSIWIEELKEHSNNPDIVIIIAGN